MNIKRIFYLSTFWALASTTLLMMSCGNEEVIVSQKPVIEEPKPPTGGSGNTDEDRYVYVAVNESINHIWVPRVYGPGNIPSEMTDGTKNALIEKLFMDDQRNLYAAGSHENAQGIPFALYWKNCSAVLLVDSTLNHYSIATDIMASGDDVYVSGYVPKNGHFAAVYWKNGEINYLTDGTTDAHTFGIFVSGEDVYVTGWLETKSEIPQAYLWKNGVGQKLNGTYASSVFVSGSEVFVTGDFGPGKYWKNGSYLTVGNVPGSGTFDVVVSNNNVYVTTEGRYWKDGAMVDLTVNDASPAMFSLCVFKDDVYIGGFENNGDKLVARYWKNGQAVDVTDGTNNAAISSIVVVSTE